MKNILIHKGRYQGEPVGRTSMTHTKKLDQEYTHHVITVEDNDHDTEEVFKGSKRECEKFIKNSGLITLTIERLCETKE